MLKISRSPNQKTAIQFVDYVAATLPFVIETIQTDNGAEFQSSFYWHVLDKDINHVYIKPRTPRLNGNVERSHRIDAEEFHRVFEGITIDDTGLFNTKPQEWQDYHNYHRAYGALGRQTSADKHCTNASNRKPKHRRKPSTTVAYPCRAASGIGLVSNVPIA